MTLIFPKSNGIGSPVVRKVKNCETNGRIMSLEQLGELKSNLFVMFITWMSQKALIKSS